ncbi:MAG: hypothetical protein U9R15_18100, partial [Chloroflexota bacterium]|nr:hypothetical protein [Chloroflexota bacterium]
LVCFQCYFGTAGQVPPPLTFGGGVPKTVVQIRCEHLDISLFFVIIAPLHWGVILRRLVCFSLIVVNRFAG